MYRRDVERQEAIDVDCSTDPGSSRNDGRERQHCQSLSSLDTSFSWSSILNDCNTVHQRHVNSRPSGPSGARNVMSTLLTTDHEEDGDDPDDFLEQFHSILLSRRTAAKPLVFAASSDTPELRNMEMTYLHNALDRAVQASQMAPNHKRTEPFTFARIWYGSQSANTLAEICYQMTLRQKSEPMAKKKKEKWAQIPAFLVTTVHNNQQANELIDAHGISDDPYTQVEYSPPMTVRQLEDVSREQIATMAII
jgi:hypothetical protein